MSYLVLARKYRPQTFEDVVGQNPVSQTLLNALTSGRVAHAYIFSGPRGVGKTTTARILAKCLNCAKGPTRTPCNECDACVSISQSNSTDDVLEIDGASNRGIEQIRELRETAKYAPSKSRYRIFIIDEAHQITKDAFGALLKTLEEPPPHVVFMMATTEVQKIPAPILSRCQRFSLRPIAANAVFEHLKRICEKEKIKVDDAALADIVRFVEGSLRDALSLLDQALVFSPTGITAQTVRDLLGLLPTDLIERFAQLVQAGEPGAILRAVDEAIKEGVDLTQLARDLQSFYHARLLTKAGVEDAFKMENASVKKDAVVYDFATLERNIRLLSKALEEMRHSETPRAIFEIYGMRLAQKTLDPKTFISQLEAVSAKSASVQAPPAAANKNEKTFTAPKLFEKPAPSFSTPLPAPTPAPIPAGVASPGPLSEGLVKAGWAEFVTDAGNIKGALQGALEESTMDVVGQRIVITFTKSFNYDLVSRSQELLKPVFAQRFGSVPTFDLKLDKSAPAPATTATSVEASALRRPTSTASEAEHFEEVAPHEITPDVQKALKHFPGTVKRGKNK